MNCWGAGGGEIPWSWLKRYEHNHFYDLYIIFMKNNNNFNHLFESAGSSVLIDDVSHSVKSFLKHCV